MCGIAGEVRFDGLIADVSAVERMSVTMEDRGPDDVGSWSANSAALAHRRLKIIDLSNASSQPIVDSYMGIVGVFNGCIYNYQQLRGELLAKGHQFFSEGDTEVVLKAYVEWGENFVDHLIGMFAIAIIERDTGRLILARDRLGIKPLYFSEKSSYVRFASTLPALLAGGNVDTEIDDVALFHYLSFHSIVPPPRTILKGVKKLPPATIRIYEPDGTSRERAYWSVAFSRNPDHAGWSARDWQDALLTSFTTAVDRRMVADLPVGVLLSGGIDSSLIVAVLAQKNQARLNTFSIGFDSVAGLDGTEFQYSDLIAREFATNHHKIHVPIGDLLSPIEAAIGAMSEPMTSHDCVGFYMVSEVVSNHLKIVQSGQGADEVLAGYEWYQLLANTQRDDALEVYTNAFLDRTPVGIAATLNPEWLAAGAPAFELVAQHFAQPGAQTAVDAALRIDSTIMLTDDPVKRVDNMTMAHGIEARVPFLDHEFVELAAACPPELKLAQNGKGVLKDLARQLLPSEVIDRPKGGFPVPSLIHLEGKLLDRVHDTMNAPEARSRNLFRPELVSDLLNKPNSQRTPLGSSKLWQLASLEMWLQANHI